jgi:simple sugar transport system ATP-binding protein
LRRLGSLSGGNAQKLVAARELQGSPRLVVADQPTRGIDLAAAAFLRSRLRAAADAGAAVLLVSSDLDEILALADRVLVLFAGRPMALVPNEGLTPEMLGRPMTGLGAELAA